MSDMLHYTEKKRQEKHACSFLQFIHRFFHLALRSFIRSLTHSLTHSAEQLSSTISFVVPSEQLYLSSTLWAICRESRFFPQKLDSSCLTPPSPPARLSSLHFRLSASQLWGETTRPQSMIIHQPQKQRRRKRQKNERVWPGEAEKRVPKFIIHSVRFKIAATN